MTELVRFIARSSGLFKIIAEVILAILDLSHSVNHRITQMLIEE